MTDAFLRAAEIGAQASVLTLAVLVLRLIFKKTPENLRCLMWGLVALRLLLPFSVRSPVSLQPDTSPLRETAEYAVSSLRESLSASPAGVPEYTTQSFPLDSARLQTPGRQSVFAGWDIDLLIGAAWLSGTSAALIYAAVSSLLLRRRVRVSVPLENNVFLCDGITSPFLFGFFCPKIYLPGGLPPEKREYVIAHEKAHIKRADHIIKPLAFLLISVYWFNPLLWIAFILFNRDLELACDERVIRGSDPAGRAAYAETLLFCGEMNRAAVRSPLAFGEVGVKTRVKRALSFKKPGAPLIVAAALTVIVAGVCLLTVPATGDPVGVELLAENGKGELSYYKILSDGTLRQKPDAPGGGYGGLRAGADCFSYGEENGIPRAQVQNLALRHADGAPAPVTEDREVIFYAVAAAARHEILKMEIFETPADDGRTFVAVEYRTEGGFSSEVFSFYPADKALVELCRAKDLRVLDVHPAGKTVNAP